MQPAHPQLTHRNKLIVHKNFGYRARPALLLQHLLLVFILIKGKVDLHRQWQVAVLAWREFNAEFESGLQKRKDAFLIISKIRTSQHRRPE